MSVTVKILAGGVIPDLNGGRLDLTTPGSAAFLLETSPLPKAALDDAAIVGCWHALHAKALAIAAERSIEPDETATISMTGATADGTPADDGNATHQVLRMLIPGTRTGRQPPRSAMTGHA
jgi:hypothetical protein